MNNPDEITTNALIATHITQSKTTASLIETKLMVGDYPGIATLNAELSDHYLEIRRELIEMGAPKNIATFAVTKLHYYTFIGEDVSVNDLASYIEDLIERAWDTEDGSFAVTEEEKELNIARLQKRDALRVQAQRFLPGHDETGNERLPF